VMFVEQLYGTEAARRLTEHSSRSRD
jgi:hypothetical protein